MRTEGDSSEAFTGADAFKVQQNVQCTIFKCVHASLKEALSVRPSVRPWVGPSVGPSVGHAFLEKREFK